MRQDAVIHLSGIVIPRPILRILTHACALLSDWIDRGLHGRVLPALMQGCEAVHNLINVLYA